MVPAGLGGLVVLVIAVGIVVLLTRDVTEFRDLLTAELSKSTGRKVAITGAFDLSIGFSPSIVAEDITIANAPWGTRPEMLKARRLEVEVGLFSILGGSVETKRLVIEGADLLFETNQAGESNWPFKSTDQARPAADAELLAADGLEINDPLITLLDGRTGRARTLKLDSATGGLDPTRALLLIEGTGALNQLPLEVKLSIGRRGPQAPPSLALKAGEAALNVQGTVEHPAEFDGFDVTATLSAPSLTALGALAGSGALPPKVGPVSLSGRLKATGKHYALDDLAASIGVTRFSGAVAVALDGAVPRITGALAATAVDLDLLLGAPAKGRKKGGGRLFSDEPLTIDLPAEGDLELSFRADSADYRGTRLSDLATTLTIKGRLAALKPLAFKLAGGAMTGEASLDLGGKAPALALRGALRGVELRQALTLFDAGQGGQGRVDIDANLRATGNSARQLAGSLGGRLDFAMGRGRLETGLIDLIAVDLFQRLMPWNVAQSYTAVNCAVARFPIERGVMRAERLLLDTSEMTMGGEGTINLARESMSLRLVPKPKDPALFSLAVPVVVEGPIASPSAAPDSEAVALGIAGSALGTLVNPLGILIPFVSAGSGDENPCVSALKGGGKKGGAEAKAKSKEKGRGKASGPVDSVIEGVGEGLGTIGKGIGSIFD
jgi:uncharacterized protein involved in outer membrane biogenesis